MWDIDRLEAIYLSPTNYCNYRCIMCPNPRMKAKRGFLKWGIFESLLDSIKRIRSRKSSLLNELHFSNEGEPFLHPDYPRMLERLDQCIKGLNIFIYTNGSILDEHTIDKLLSLKNNQYYYIFSLDASHDELYRRIRIGGDYEKLERIVQLFLEKKGSLNQYNPYVVLQFIVMAENQHDQHAFYWKWEPFLGPKIKASDFLWWPLMIDYNGAHVFWKKPAHGWGNHQITLLREVFKDNSGNISCFYPDKGISPAKVCAWPWRKICIGWDGGVGFCCMHWELQGILGSVEEKSIEEIFTGDNTEHFRSLFWKNRINEIPGCRKCDKRDWWYDQKLEEELSSSC